MKVLIVFLGLLVINMGFICYQGDMSSFLQLQKELKAAAEESAAGASLFYDETEYGMGNLVVKDEDAVNYVEYTANQAELNLKRSNKPALAGQGKLSYTLHIVDEKDGGKFRSYRDGRRISLPDSALPESVRRVEGAGHVMYEPSVVVDLTLSTGDLFRLPFLEVRSISRSAMYELSGNQSMG